MLPLLNKEKRQKIASLTYNHHQSRKENLNTSLEVRNVTFRALMPATRSQVRQWPTTMSKRHFLGTI